MGTPLCAALKKPVSSGKKPSLEKMKFQASVFRAAHACCPCFADARIPDSNHEGGKTSMRNYTTQMDAARKGILTPELEIVAKKENMTTEALMKLVAEGKLPSVQTKTMSA